MKKLIRRILFKLLSWFPEDVPPLSPDTSGDAVISTTPAPLSGEASQAEPTALPGAPSPGKIAPLPATVIPGASTPKAGATALVETTLSVAGSQAEPLTSPDAVSTEETAPPPGESPLSPITDPILLRTAFRNYIKGSGLEIGALHNPLDISGLAITEIRYVDRMTEEELARQYPELEGQPLVHVDIIDDGELLSTIPDASVDFIIGNHFLEHTRNPIGTIENWLKKLTPHGILFLAIPDQRFTFDECRALTPVEHMVEDYQCDLPERQARDHQHFWEWAVYIYKIPEEISHRHADYLEEINYSIHFHTFRLQSFLSVLQYMQAELHIPFELKACADVLAGGNEFLVILSPPTPETPLSPQEPPSGEAAEQEPAGLPVQAPPSATSGSQG